MQSKYDDKSIPQTYLFDRIKSYTVTGAHSDVYQAQTRLIYNTFSRSAVLNQDPRASMFYVFSASFRLTGHYKDSAEPDEEFQDRSLI